MNLPLRFKEKTRQFLFFLTICTQGTMSREPKNSQKSLSFFFTKTLILYFSLSISHLKRTIENTRIQHWRICTENPLSNYAFTFIQWSETRRLGFRKVLLTHTPLYFAVDDEAKRRQIEGMVRKELDHWDSSRPSTSESDKDKKE